MELEKEVETMLGIQAGMTALFASLIATHPDYRQFQLVLTSFLEVTMEGSFGLSLSDHQKQAARAYVEVLQQIHEVHAKIDPLRSLGLPGGTGAS